MTADTLHGPEVTAVILPPLSRRETEAALWVAEGKDNATIAAIIGCSPRTAKAHVQRAELKVGVHNRAHLVSRLYRLGILSTRAALLVIAVSTSLNLDADNRTPPRTPRPITARRLAA